MERDISRDERSEYASHLHIILPDSNHNPSIYKRDAEVQEAVPVCLSAMYHQSIFFFNFYF